MGFIVIYDASVIYGGLVRDLLIRVAAGGLVQAKWTSEILDEAFDNLLENRPDLSRARLQRTRELMTEAVRDSLVEGYQPLIDGLNLPDPDDRHVLAAAIRSGAQVIVTSNIKDFPDEALQPFGITAQLPDDFLSALVELDPNQLWSIVDAIASKLREPESREEILRRLRRNGLDHTATELELA